MNPIHPEEFFHGRVKLCKRINVRSAWANLIGHFERHAGRGRVLLRGASIKVTSKPSGSKDQNTRVSGPEYDVSKGIWALTAYYSGPWPLRETQIMLR